MHIEIDSEYNMGTFYSPPLVHDGLIFCVDIKNTKSHTSGTTVTDLGKGHDGTIRGSGATTSNGILELGNNTAYLDFRSNTSDYTHIGAWTIAAWVKRTGNFGTYTRVLGKQIGTGNAKCNYGVGMYNYKAGVIANDGSWRTVYDTGGDDFVLNQWHHVVGMYNGSSHYTLYVDNSQRFNTAVTLNMTNAASESGAAVQIGTNYQGTEKWVGNFGPVQVYNRALSAAEVSRNFNAHRNRFGV